MEIEAEGVLFVLWIALANLSMYCTFERLFTSIYIFYMYVSMNYKSMYLLMLNAPATAAVQNQFILCYSSALHTFMYFL